MSLEREVEFHAALLELGAIDCTQFVSFDPTGEPKAWRKRADRTAFMDHRARLIDWLVIHNVMGRMFTCSVRCKGSPHAHTLSSPAAIWIGEFYQWMCKMQDERL